MRALTGERLGTLLNLMPTRHRLTFRFLAATGLRVSELFAIQWRHLELDGRNPHARVRRALVRGKLEPPKTRHGRRDVPLSPALVRELRAWRKATEWPGDEDLVFPTLTGTAQNYGNLRHRVLAPAAQEAGVPWVGFHTFRHTCASMLFEARPQRQQVQRWLGHHAASFTLDTYIHLLSAELDEPLELPTSSRLLEPILNQQSSLRRLVERRAVGVRPGLAFARPPHFPRGVLTGEVPRRRAAPWPRPIEHGIVGFLTAVEH